MARLSPRQISDAEFEALADKIADKIAARLTSVANPPTTPTSYLTIRQCAERLSISTATVWRRIRGGELTATKIGGSTRIAECELQKLAGGAS